MNKKKSVLLTVASVLSIVASVLGFLGSIAIFCLGNMFTEEDIKETYFDNPAYKYYEDENGSYYFYYYEDDTEIRLYEDEIEKRIEIGKFIFNAAGIIVALFSLAKLILAIRVLCVGSGKVFGSLISLLVLNVLSVSLIETILIAFVLCLKDEKQPRLLAKMIKK